MTTVSVQLCRAGDGSPAGLVFSADDVLLLRKQHRVIGTLIGTLAHKPMQNQVMSLPLQISTEELCLLGQLELLDGDTRSKLREQLTSTTATSESLMDRIAVYSALWHRGFYVITGGASYGCDMLVYEADPLRCHSAFTVNIVPYSKRSIRWRDLSATLRVATKSRKRHLLCAVIPSPSPSSSRSTTPALRSFDDRNAKDRVQFMTVSWAGM